MKKKYVLTFKIFVTTAALLILFNSGQQKIMAKPNDGVPITVDKDLEDLNGNSLSLALPYDTDKIYESALQTNPTYNDYVQNNENIFNLEKKNKIHASSSIVNDSGQSYVKTSDGKGTIYVRGFSNYGMGLPEVTFGKIEKVNQEGEVVKSIYIGEIEPQWENSRTDGSYIGGYALHDSKDGTYFVPYTLSNNVRMFIRINDDLDIIERKKFDENGFTVDGQGRNRSSVDYLGRYWDITFTSRSSAQQNKLYGFKTDNAGKYLDRISFDFISYETIFPDKPNDWWIGIQSNTFKNTADGYVGLIAYAHGMEVGYVVTRWDSSGAMKGSYISDGTIQFQEKISDESNYYFMEYATNAVILKKLDTVTGDVSTIKTYPKGTNLNFAKSDIGYSIYGYVAEFSGEFVGYGESGSAVIGLTDSQFNIQSLNIIETSEPVNVSGLIPINNQDFFFAGTFANEENELVDDVTNATLGISGWAQKQTSLTERKINQNFFYGILKMTADWAPVIQAPKNVTVNIDDPDIQQENQEVISNWLITGSKTGTLADADAVKVYDTFDLESSLGNYSQDWLNARINRNPKTMYTESGQLLYAPIDWPALGFNPKERGPQLVTYYVSDSQGQLSTTSRWVNKVDDTTVHNDEAALAVSNFAIDVKEIATSLKNSEDANALAKMLAWKKADGSIIDSGTEKKGAVTVDTAELTTLQQIKDQLASNDPATLIKPYPLTFKLDYKGQTLRQTVTVFVTDETTYVDTTNQVVLYAFDFEEDLRNTPPINAEKTKERGRVSAWSYNMKWGESAYPLSDITLESIQNAGTTYPGFDHITAGGDYQMNFLYKKTRNEKATGHIYETPVVIHLRQVLLDENAALVSPTQGYVALENTDGTQVAQVTNVKVNTRKDTTYTFDPFTLEMSYKHWQYQLKPVEPQYYEYAGYVATPTEENDAHEASKKKDGHPSLDFASHDEYWVTIYLKGTTVHPKFYSQDVQAKDIGEISN